MIENQRDEQLREAGKRWFDYIVALIGEYQPGDILERKEVPARFALPF